MDDLLNSSNNSLHHFFTYGYGEVIKNCLFPFIGKRSFHSLLLVNSYFNDLVTSYDEYLLFFLRAYLFNKVASSPPMLPSIQFLRSKRGQYLLYFHISLFSLYEHNCSYLGQPIFINMNKLVAFGKGYCEHFKELLKYFQWKLTDGLECSDRTISSVARLCKRGFKEYYRYKKHRSFPEALGNAISQCVEYCTAVTNVDESSLAELCDSIVSNYSELRTIRPIMLATAQYSPEFLRKDKTFSNDREIVLEAVKTTGVILKFVSDELKNDKEIVLAAVTRYGPALKFASPDLQNDRQVVLTAVREKFLGYEALRYAQPSFKNDKKIVLEAIETNGYALEHASLKLKSDREVVLAAVRSNGRALEYACPSLKRDKIVVLEAVRKRGDALEYASNECKEDKQIVLEAVKSKGHAIVWASKSMRRSRDILLEAIRNCYDLDVIRYFHRVTDIPTELKDDKEIILEMVKFSGRLDQASARLRDDYEVVHTSVSRDPSSIRFASFRLRDNSEIVHLAIRDDGMLLKYASERLRDDRVIVGEAVRENSDAIRFASNKVKHYLKEYPALKAERRAT